MEHWKLITIMVTVFAFFLEIRPMDSFLTAYFTSPEVNVTLDEVSNELTPIRIYFAIFGSLLVLLLADYLLYKPIMILNGIIGMLAYASLIASPTMVRLKIAEVCLSLFTCSEVSYYGYLYAKIKDKEHYQIATGCAKAGMLSGTCVSGLIGQLVIYLNNCNYSTLPYYSLVGMSFASVWSCFFPSVKQNKHDVFYAAHNSEKSVKTYDFSKTIIHDPNIPKYSSEKVNRQKIDLPVAVTKSFKHVYEDFKYSYTDHTVLKWSFWHVIGISGYVQIILYINILYTYTVDSSNDNTILLNGLVDSLATMCAAICTYNIGNLQNVNWNRYGDTFLTFSSLMLGLTVCLCFYLKNIILVYIMYIFYDTLVQSVFVIVVSQIATALRDDCYTLVLGFNAFLGIVLGTLSSTLLVHLGISIPAQFLVYGGLYLVLGVLYGFCALIFVKKKITVTNMFKRLP